MFTVLYRDEFGADNLICDVSEVQRRRSRGVGDPQSSGVTVIFSDGASLFYEDCKPVSIDSAPREFIVMNEHGKTVAKWGL